MSNNLPSSIYFRVSLHREVQDSIGKIRELITSTNTKQQLKEIINNFTLADLNRALYRCDQEERDEGKGFGVYNIPNYGPLVYCGFQGFISLLANIRAQNDLGHPMCCNLRDGNWMIGNLLFLIYTKCANIFFLDYIWQRLKIDNGTRTLGQWLEENLKPLKEVPRYLIPCYFDVTITGVYIMLLEHCYELMSE